MEQRDEVAYSQLAAFGVPYCRQHVEDMMRGGRFPASHVAKNGYFVRWYVDEIADWVSRETKRKESMPQCGAGTVWAMDHGVSVARKEYVGTKIARLKSIERALQKVAARYDRYPSLADFCADVIKIAEKAREQRETMERDAPRRKMK